MQIKQQIATMKKQFSVLGENICHYHVPNDYNDLTAARFAIICNTAMAHVLSSTKNYYKSLVQN